MRCILLLQMPIPMLRGVAGPPLFTEVLVNVIVLCLRRKPSITCMVLSGRHVIYDYEFKILMGLSQNAINCFF